ncbi:hypothetical protein FACS189494_08420 [Spirochaetia bacterium]|nr:hypothetical protein FACS189494_08420 [Spirochaetia bacterium]
MSNKKMRKNGFLSLLTIMFVFGMVVISCATSVPIKSVKVPTIDTSGIQKLGVVEDFGNISGVNNPQLTRYLADKARGLITNTGKFTVVAPTDPNRDGLFSGELTDFKSKDSQETRQAKDKDGKPYTIITYKRDVSIEFSYSVISARTHVAIGKVIKKGAISSSSTRSPSELTDTLGLAKSIVDSQMSGLSKDIVPYIVSEKRKLMNETSKDKVLKERMKTVVALIKNQNYEEAIKQYDIIYSETGSVAAKTNAGILRQSIASDIAATTQLTALFNDKDGLAEKAAKQSVDALNSKLPSKTNISIMKASATESDMLDYVVDQMTKSIIKAGNITIIDRANQDLITAEQKFQLSGYVDDKSAISIGKQLGVKYMVLLSIAGQMSNRRLTTKVLNVETARVEYQNDVEI